MTRHPGTEGNDLRPRSVTAIRDISIEDGAGEISLRSISSDVRQQAIAYQLVGL